MNLTGKARAGADFAWTLFAWIAVAGGILCASALSASAQTSSGASSNPEQKWGKICVQSGGGENCNVRYTLYTQQGQLVVGVNLATQTGAVKRQIFQVVVPSWRAIAPGITMQIDDGNVNPLAYSVCLPNRCLAELPLDQGLLDALKGGKKINFVSTNYRNKENPVSVTLIGFTKAYDGPPLEQAEVEAQQKKLEEELRKKAEETRRKLKEAQEKAKSGG